MHIPIREVSPEGVFARHYDWLLKWAAYLVRGRQEQAEDLVHELFIQFQRTSPDLTTDEEAKAYLYRSLRNLFLSSVARNTVAQHHQLSIYDYDNFRIGISAIDRGSLLSVREDLWSICHYACERKASLRAASYFILRFFLEYCPSEIMALACTNRAAFDKNIQLMRGEVCSHMQHPGSPLVTRRPAEDAKLDEREGDLFQQLSRFIHTFCHGSCLTPDEIRFLYSAGVPVETTVLAHLVSCEPCRTACLHHLDKDSGQYATLSDRGAVGTRSSSGLSVVRRTRRASLDELYRRYQENFEHRPAYLHLSIAGKTEASQRITSLCSELSASLSFEEMPVFIEIAGEQGIRMLSLLLDEDLNLPDDVRASTPLSDGRSLHMEASSRAGSLQVRVTYIDPVVEQDDEEPSTLPNALANMHVQPRPIGIAARIKDRISRAFMDFYWPSAIAGTAALALCLFTFTTQAHHRYLRQQALGILVEANHSEKATISRHDVHRVGTFEVEGPDGKPRQRRVEVWQSNLSSHRAMRLYGADGREQAFTLKPFEASNDPQPEEVWRAGFETSFAEQIFREAALETVKKEANTYRIEAHSESHPVRGIVEADIVLDRKSNRVVEQRFVIRRIDGDYHVHLVETQYEVTSQGHFGPEIFSPPSTDASPSSGEQRLPRPASTQSRSELVSQQIKALWQLQQADVEPEEQIAVNRHGQSLRISGVVMTEQRKQHLADSMLTVCPSCELYLQTPRHHRSNLRVGHLRPTTLQTSDVAVGASDAENLFRPALLRLGLDTPQIRERSAAQAMELTSLAARLLRDTDALEQSAGCCSRAELASLGVNDRQLWLRLLSTQSKRIESSLAALEGKMADLSMLAGVSVTQPNTQDLNGSDGLAEIRRLHSLAVTLQLSLQHFSAAGLNAEQDATPHWQQILTQTHVLHQQLNLASSFVRNPR
ncbi:RNA polymerase sigma factor [Edaphobacter modestus]|nr:sigma factor [Edaphobacter modestus]